MFKYNARKGKKLVYELTIFGYMRENFRYKGTNYQEYKDMIFQSDYFIDNRNKKITEEDVVKIIKFSKEYGRA